jgi:hypothetical protein
MPWFPTSPDSRLRVDGFCEKGDEPAIPGFEGTWEGLLTIPNAGGGGGRAAFLLLFLRPDLLTGVGVSYAVDDDKLLGPAP